MGKIIEIRPEVIHWTIVIEPNDADYVSVSRGSESGHVIATILTDSFDRIDDLRKQALALARRE